MSESAAYPSIITNKLFQVEARKVTYLTNDITSSQTAIVADTTGFPSEGFITIENETIYYPSITALQFGGTCTRGYAGTAVSHLAGVMVRLSVAAATINRIIAEIVAIQTYGGTSGGNPGYMNARYLGGSTDAAFVSVGGTQTITAPKTFKKIVNTIVAATDGATVTFDMSLGNIQKVVLGDNRTLALSNVSVGQCFILDLVQDGTGSRTVTWFAGISWADGSAPTLTTTASKRDSLGFICTAANTYQGYIVGQNI